ncbi:hypothetical protein HDV03_004240 [Kappamyces sp. JEL0829]|nr:hypothetical protein HDV03_004240 [Kappamyces sp. JEL0829]
MNQPLPVAFWIAQFTTKPFHGRRFVAGLLFLAMVYVAADWMANLASILSPTFDVPALPDQLFAVLPEGSPDLLYLTDIFAEGGAALGVLLCIYHAWGSSLIPAIQLSECMSLAYILRSTVVAITNMPDPRSSCEKVTPSTLLTNFSTHRCGDAMFSGHTVLMSLFALCVTTHFPQTRPLLYRVVVCLAWTWAFVGMLSILINRTHYSSDVLVALYICHGVWWGHLYFHSRMTGTWLALEPHPEPTKPPPTPLTHPAKIVKP